MKLNSMLNFREHHFTCFFKKNCLDNHLYVVVIWPRSNAFASIHPNQEFRHHSNVPSTLPNCQKWGERPGLPNYELSKDCKYNFIIDVKCQQKITLIYIVYILISSPFHIFETDGPVVQLPSALFKYHTKFCWYGMLY